MARRSVNEPLYKVFRRFLDECILGDRSLLWPDKRVWTRENVAEVRQRMVGEPIEGTDLSFEQKLGVQMKGADPEQWMMVSDLFFVFSLVSNSLKLEKKHSYIEWAVEQGGLEEPSDEAELWEAQEAGFSRTGQRYNRKYGQFWLLILFAEHLKDIDGPEEVLKDQYSLEETLDTILEEIQNKGDRAYDMRHAILYMVFPEAYERIISTSDKQKIAKFYDNLLDSPIEDDLDEAIRRIREVLAPHYDGEEPFDFYSDLKKEWRGGKPPLPPPVIKGSGAVDETPALAKFVLSNLAWTRNLVLHGPPGTGKTYVARQAARELLRGQEDGPSSELASSMEIVEGLSLYEVLALSMYEHDPASSHGVSEIAEQELLQARYQTLPVKNPRENIWGSLQYHADPASQTVNTSRRAAPYLFDKEDGGRWFLTGAGRDYVESELSESLAKLHDGAGKDVSGARFVEWTTFHQSYAYEDFVEGLRPVPSEEDPSGISYQVLPGVFRRICARAAADPENDYILVIDEINRGNIAKIFGELMTLLEDDKRAGEPSELTVTLPYSGDAFSVPNNLYVIGTMNTADRSIALLDVALRRRFAFVEAMPDPTLIDGIIVEHEGLRVDLGILLRVLNQSIVHNIDRDHQVGHSYLLTVAGADVEERLQVLEFVWNSQILPLLEEYFYTQREKLAQLLAPFREDEEFGDETEPDHDNVELARKTGDELMFSLHQFIETSDF